MSDSRVLDGLYGGIFALMSKGFYDLAQQVKQVPSEVNYAITILSALFAIDLLANAVRNKEPYNRRFFNYVTARLK